MAALHPGAGALKLFQVVEMLGKQLAHHCHIILVYGLGASFFPMTPGFCRCFHTESTLIPPMAREMRVGIRIFFQVFTHAPRRLSRAEACCRAGSQ
jgi:hypothetical protein